MKRDNIVHKGAFWTIVVFVLLQTVPQLRFVFRGNTTVAFIAGLFLLVVYNPQILVSKFSFVVFVGLILRIFLLWYHGGAGYLSFLISIQEAFMVLLSVSCWEIMLRFGDYVLMKRVGIIFLGFLIFQMFVTLLSPPGASYYMVGFDTMDNFGRAEYAGYAWRGIMNYGKIHMLPVLVVAFMGVAALVREKKIKILMYALTFLSFLTVLHSRFTTALLFVIIAALFAFVRSKYTWILFLVVAFSFVVLKILWDSGFIVWVFSTVGEAMGEGNHIANKAIDLQLLQDGADAGDAVGRANLYMLSLDAFLSNPLMGSGPGSIGGHGYLLDIMGSSGLPCLLLYLGMFSLAYMRVVVCLPHNIRWYVLLMLLTMLGINCLKSTSIPTSVMVVYLLGPCLLIFPRSVFREVSNRYRMRCGMPPMFRW